MVSGVYFSANDEVLQWTLPFLTSFRSHNPTMPLCLIPFDTNIEGILSLSDKFSFTIYEDESFFELEAIGRKLELGHASYGPNWFRRYAAFWGPFEDFIYLDARQVILSDLTEFLKATSTYDLDLVYYDTVLNQVYEPGPFRISALKSGYARGFNSGRWASRKGLFTLDLFRERLQEQLVLRSQLNQRNTDQAFINHCCDTERVRMAKISDLLGDVVCSGWARQPGQPYQDESGIWRLWDHGGTEHKLRLILMHWAGYSAEDLLPNAALLRRFGGKFQSNKVRMIRKWLAADRTARKILGRLN